MQDPATPPPQAVIPVGPPDDGQLVDVPGARLFARLRGAGPVTVVVETALAGLSAEWWRLQDRIGEFARVLTYDRAGYGRSTPHTRPRTSRHCADDLWRLLQALGVDGPYLLVGHSQGGLYVQHFARLHPDRVAAAVLLDPLSHDDGRFRAELPPDVYRKSGVDKTPAF